MVPNNANIIWVLIGINAVDLKMNERLVFK